MGPICNSHYTANIQKMIINRESMSCRENIPHTRTGSLLSLLSARSLYDSMTLRNLDSHFQRCVFSSRLPVKRQTKKKTKPQQNCITDKPMRNLVIQAFSCSRIFFSILGTWSILHWLYHFKNTPHEKIRRPVWHVSPCPDGMPTPKTGIDFV